MTLHYLFDLGSLQPIIDFCKDFDAKKRMGNNPNQNSQRLIN
jgi:hypothetical protein